ncbi:MAG: hypothetical protein GW878_01530 [Acidobacteria bacterium]|nr:hypothetical protein [Acidobacteriota bacterium]
MTSCSSSAHVSWRRLASLGVLLAVLATPAFAAGVSGRSGDLDQVFSRLTQSMQGLDSESVRERTDEILDVATRVGLRRLTPYALAIVTATKTMPPATAKKMLVQAARLDPDSPEVFLALARQQAATGRRAAALATTVRGLVSAMRDVRLRSLVFPSATISLTVGALVAFLAWFAVATFKTAPRVWHDLDELAVGYRLGASAPVAAAVLFALPAFIGGDPFWLAVWLIALVWPYLSPPRKAIAALGLLLIAATPTLLEVSFGHMTHPPDPVNRGAEALAEGRYDPQGIEELNSLADLFADDGQFRRLLGDLNRQAGNLDAAAAAYREGLRTNPQQPQLLLALGIAQYLDSDFNAALQSFKAAREAGADRVTSSFNLALALAQTYHYRESDEALEEARRADPRRLRELTRGREHDLLIASFSPADAAAMLRRRDPIALLNRSVLPPPVGMNRTILHPATIGALLALALAIGHYLVRRRTTGFASACLKCGRTFCPRCKLSTESRSYCSQCVNIFLKKDMVAIETQMAKRRQLGRRTTLLRIERRIADFVLPGLGLSFAGQPVAGAALIIVAMLAMTATLFWLPVYLLPGLMAWDFDFARLVPATAWLAALAVAQTVHAGEV